MVWSTTAFPSPTTAPLIRSLLFCQLLEAPPPPPHTSNRGRLATHRPYPSFTCRTTSIGGVRTNAAAAVPDRIDEEDDSDSPPPGSSTRAQLDLLQQLASNNSSTSRYGGDGATHRLTIREQLSELVGGKGGEFTLPLGKRLLASVKSLSISQKRNIKRQAYLNEVSGRNDSVFFAKIAAFVILPPVAILAVAVLTGYVELLP